MSSPLMAATTTLPPLASPTATRSAPKDIRERSASTWAISVSLEKASASPMTSQAFESNS